MTVRMDSQGLTCLHWFYISIEYRTAWHEYEWFITTMMKLRRGINDRDHRAHKLLHLPMARKIHYKRRKFLISQQNKMETQTELSWLLWAPFCFENNTNLKTWSQFMKGCHQVWMYSSWKSTWKESSWYTLSQSTEHLVFLICSVMNQLEPDSGTNLQCSPIMSGAQPFLPNPQREN